ncbi:hypothetical protein BDW22DRAFT_57363 [Trametopsis cervina]|nr:hypothetical protein BDW22DRAFT_57363 [Trametopsis cervina]
MLLKYCIGSQLALGALSPAAIAKTPTLRVFMQHGLLPYRRNFFFAAIAHLLFIYPLSTGRTAHYSMSPPAIHTSSHFILDCAIQPTVDLPRLPTSRCPVKPYAVEWEITHCPPSTQEIRQFKRCPRWSVLVAELYQPDSYTCRATEVLRCSKASVSVASWE